MQKLPSQRHQTSLVLDKCSMVTGERFGLFADVGAILDTPDFTLTNISGPSPCQTAPLNMCQNRSLAIHESTHDHETLVIPEAANAESRMGGSRHVSHLGYCYGVTELCESQ